jgi:hypothetical protein
MHRLTLFLLAFTATLALGSASFIGAQEPIPDPYPGHPLVDNVAAAQNCADDDGTPPPPTGYHWAYDIECIATAAQAHEDGWRAAHTQYTKSKAALQAKIAEKQARIAELNAQAQEPNPPANMEYLINAAINQLTAFKAALEAVESAWTETQAELRDKFYEDIDDCCIYQQNG